MNHKNLRSTVRWLGLGALIVSQPAFAVCMYSTNPYDNCNQLQWQYNYLEGQQQEAEQWRAYREPEQPQYPGWVGKRW